MILKKIESKRISAPARTTFDLQTIINKATTTNQMELLTLEEAKFLIGTEFIIFIFKQGSAGRDVPVPGIGRGRERPRMANF